MLKNQSQYLFLIKPDRQRIHAMTGIFFRQTFPDKYMAEMSSAMVANDLGPASVRVRYPPYSAFDLIIERRPATAAIELVA